MKAVDGIKMAALSSNKNLYSCSKGGGRYDVIKKNYYIGYRMSVAVMKKNCKKNKRTGGTKYGMVKN